MKGTQYKIRINKPIQRAGGQINMGLNNKKRDYKDGSAEYKAHIKSAIIKEGQQ